jgi:putative addiction module component (TIGR02574 family)
MPVRFGWAYTRRMSETAEQLLKKALSLNERDRASLAGALIESLNAKLDPGAAQAWDVEIERRVKELESHAVETVPWSKVRERLFRGFE